MRHFPAVTAIGFPSGGRPEVYAKREFIEQAEVLRRMREEPDFRQTLLVSIVENYAIQQTSPPLDKAVRNTLRDFVRRRLASYWNWPKGRGCVYPLTIALRKRLRRAATAIGLHAETVEFFFRYRRRGGIIRFLWKHRGLPERSGENNARARAMVRGGQD